MEILELVKIYEAKCKEDCKDCSLGRIVTRMVEDVPLIPENLTICILFDYINLNKDNNNG